MPPISSSSVKYSTTMSSDKDNAMKMGNSNEFSRDVNKQLRLNHDSMTSDDLDGDDEDRLVIADEDADASGGLFIFLVYIFCLHFCLHFLFAVCTKTREIK